MLGRRRGAVHLSADALGDLRGRDSYPAGRSVDQHPLALLEASHHDKSRLGGRVVDGERCALLEGQLLGQLVDHVLPHRDELCLAVEARTGEHPITGLPKGGRPRIVPLPMPAVHALARLSTRDDFTTAEDYVLVNRFGRRLDASALRRRYKRGCDAARLRPVRLHGLRHAAGSLVARTSDAVFIRDFLGHRKLSTTDRYVSAKARPEELERLDAAFAPASVPTPAVK